VMDPRKEYSTEEGLTKLQGALADEKRPALAKYQEITVGSRSLTALLKYELFSLFLMPLPGALGLLLRKKCSKGLFGSVGKNVVIGRNVVVRHPHKVRLGSGVVIDDNVVLDAKGESNAGIEIGDNVIIGRNTALSCKDGDLSIGANSNIAMNCFIQSGKEVRIGENVLIAAYCYVIGGGDHKSDRIDVPVMRQGQVIEGITIGDNCWLGAGVLVQDGSTIGRDSIVGSGAVVTKDIREYSVAVGVPAKVVKDRRADV